MLIITFSVRTSSTASISTATASPAPSPPTVLATIRVIVGAKDCRIGRWWTIIYNTTMSTPAERAATVIPLGVILLCLFGIPFPSSLRTELPHSIFLTFTFQNSPILVLCSTFLLSNPFAFLEFCFVCLSDSMGSGAFGSFKFGSSYAFR